MSDYLDFEIQLTPLDGGRHTLVARGPGGEEVRAEVALPGDSPAYQFLAARLAELAVDEGILAALGGALFQALFPEPVRQMYAGCRGALAHGQRLRLRLNIAADDPAAALPWEFLHDAERRALALHDTPIVRYLPQPEKLAPLSTALPLRVLLSGSHTPPPLAIGRELAEVRAALESLGELVQIAVEPHLTAAALQRRLREGFHVWHFVGHGGFAPDGASGRLLFEDEQGDPWPVSAAELQALLDGSGVRLAVLDTCEGARLATDPLRSLAPALIRARVPAVVAMQFAAPEETARAFAGEFYRALAQGLPIDACATEGRRAVMRTAGIGRADWGIPAVYTRALDGRLFDLRAAPAPQAEDMRSAGAGLDALRDLMAQPEVRAAVAAFEADFQDVRRRIDALAGHKRLHDLLQELESCYGTIHHFIYEGGRLVPEERLSWPALERIEPELESAIDRVLEFAATPAAVESAVGIQRLARARDELRQAVDTSDPAALRGGTRRITEVLGRELSRVNTRLVAAAGEVRLEALARALAALLASSARARLMPADAQRLATVERGAEALGHLTQRLAAAVACHNLFQIVDDELRWIETQVEQDPGELSYAWRGLRPKVAELVGTPAPWAARLSAIATDLDQALEAGGTRAPRTFGSFRSQAGRSFNQVDHDLLALCEELQKVAEPLSAVLRML